MAGTKEISHQWWKTPSQTVSKAQREYSFDLPGFFCMARGVAWTTNPEATATLADMIFLVECGSIEIVFPKGEPYMVAPLNRIPMAGMPSFIKEQQQRTFHPLMCGLPIEPGSKLRLSFRDRTYVDGGDKNLAWVDMPGNVPVGFILYYRTERRHANTGKDSD